MLPLDLLVHVYNIITKYIIQQQYLPSCQYMSIEAQPRIIADAIHDDIHRWEGLQSLDEKFKVHGSARTDGVYGGNACIVDIVWHEITDVDTSSNTGTSLEGAHQRGV